jgi:hypothetical protein
MRDDLSATYLLSDGDIARFLSISKSWVRKERWARRHELKHTFTVDPVMIGRCPRYRLTDVQAWLERQGVTLREATNG